MAEDISYEEHVLKNNLRLASIKQSLSSTQTFSSACSELTQWCSDQRAFSASFEENLLSALQVAVENGTKEGYDFPLAHQLISACFTYRKHLSKESANRINRWYEQFRRLKKSGGKKKRTRQENSQQQQQQQQQQVQSMIIPSPFDSLDEKMTDIDSGSMWPVGAPPNGSPMASPNFPIPMNAMQHYGQMQPSPYPMDPHGARPYPDASGMYQENSYAYQRRMMAMQQQQMQARRGVMPIQQPHDYMPVPMGVNNVPGQSQPLMRYPGAPPMPSPAYLPINGRPMLSPIMPGQEAMAPMQNYPNGANAQMIRAAPPVLFGQIQQQGQQQQVMAFPNPNIPPDGRYPMPGYIPDQGPPIMIMPRDTIMAPFSLEHNVMETRHTFNIPHEIMQQLANPSMEVMLKSFNKQDRTMMSQWPKKDIQITVMISVNGQNVPIRYQQKSVFLKNLLRQGENEINFTALDCCCSHSFVLQLIMRQPVQRIAQEIYQNASRMSSVESSKAKLLRHVHPGGIRIPLTYSPNGHRINVPARSQRCQHATCFDLELFLTNHTESHYLTCNICGIIFPMHEIEVDLFMHQIITNTTSIITEVALDQSGNWKPIEMPSVPVPLPESRKRTVAENSTTNFKRIKSEPFPTTQSPFPPPGSVPTLMNHSPSIMSPFVNNLSPKKEVLSPPASRLNGGPATPATPGLIQNMPSSTDLSGAQNPSSVGHPTPHTPINRSSTSPHQTHIQQHGSVEAPSLTGSAPYTPSSVGPGAPVTSSASTDRNFTNLGNISSGSLDIECLDDVFHCNISDDDFKKLYLPSIQDHPNGLINSIKHEDTNWDDITALISGKI